LLPPSLITNIMAMSAADARRKRVDAMADLSQQNDILNVRIALVDRDIQLMSTNVYRRTSINPLTRRKEEHARLLQTQVSVIVQLAELREQTALEDHELAMSMDREEGRSELSSAVDKMIDPYWSVQAQENRFIASRVPFYSEHRDLITPARAESLVADKLSDPAAAAAVSKNDAQPYPSHRDQANVPVALFPLSRFLFEKESRGMSTLSESATTCAAAAASKDFDDASPSAESEEDDAAWNAEEIRRSDDREDARIKARDEASSSSSSAAAAASK
jgi:hypothetical protein